MLSNGKKKTKVISGDTESLISKTHKHTYANAQGCFFRGLLPYHQPSYPVDWADMELLEKYMHMTMQ